MNCRKCHVKLFRCLSCNGLRCLCHPQNLETAIHYTEEGVRIRQAIEYSWEQWVQWVNAVAAYRLARGAVKEG